MDQDRASSKALQLAGSSSRWLGLIAAGIIIVAVGVWLLWRFVSPAQEMRNILLISIDTCRADRLSCYGYKSKTTPNIDAVAAEGVLFENVIAPVPLTLPSHSSMLTGTIPPYHGVHDNVGGYLADEPNVTLAEILKDAGFTTGAAISALPLYSKYGIGQGFQTYNDHFEETLKNSLMVQRQGGQTTRVALSWLEKNKDKKFFFFLHYFDPHRDYQPPEPFASRFVSSPYAGEIAYTDHCIGRVLDKLKELGLYDSTLVIITSDHGEMLGEHGEVTHAYFIYQSAIRVPLIFKLPGQNKPVRIKSIAGLIDIVPTICGLLGIEAPKNVQGVDLFASSKGESTSGQDRHIFCESLYPTKYDANTLLGVVNDRYKYIQTTRPELYDLANDPGESNNLVTKQPQLARIMKDKLAQILEQTVRKDSGPNKIVDPEDLKRFEGLGYVGGAVAEDFSFDQTKDDPKDLARYHRLAMRITSPLMKKDSDKAEMYAKQLIQERPDLARGYKVLAEIALEQEDYSGALVHYERAIELGLDTASAVEVYKGRGWTYFNVGEHNLAMRDLDQAIKLDPKDAGGYYYRARVYSSKGEYDQAIRDIDQAIKLDPNNAEIYNIRAGIYVARGELDKAIADFDHVIRLDPKAGAYINRGIAYADKGELDKAVADYSRVIRLDPEFAKAYNNRGNAYVRKGDLDKAVADYSQAIRLDPEYAEAYNNQGNAYVRKGELDKAIVEYNQAIGLDPEYADAWYNRGATYADKGELDKAVADYDQAIKLDPEYAEVYNNRGVAYFRKGDLDKAVADYSQAIRLRPKAEAYNNRGVAYFLKGQLDKAVADYSQAVRLDAKFAKAYNNRGNAYFRKGDLDKAVADYSQAIRLKPKYAEAYTSRGDAYVNKGELDKAIADYNQAIGLKPKDAKAYNNLAWILATCPESRIRDGAEAVGLAERACQLKNYKTPTLLDTLAAAYAEAGEFDKAVKTAQKAIQLARAAKREKLAKDIQSRLELYKAKRPYRTDAR